VQIIDDVLVLTDVQGNKFFVCDGFSFDVFCTISILESVDCLFELTARRAHIHNHNCFTVAP
jgi:hypothetical protein